MPFEPLQAVVGMWISKIQEGLLFKGRRFQRDADEGMRFFTGPYEWLYGAETRRTDRHFRQTFDDEDDSEVPPPKFQMTVNKVAELVQLFGPVLYHKNPTRQVNPREYPLPDNDLLAAFGATPQTQMFLTQLYQQGQQAQATDRARAAMLEFYLNYTPNALDLKTESRWAIDEALIKGMGCLWTEVYTPPGGGGKMVGSFYDSVDNLIIDPDMPTLRHAKWICRRRCEAVWEVERKFGYPAGYLKANLESMNRQAEVLSHPDGNYLRATGQTNDLLTYWEVYSKTGIGGRLAGIDRAVTQPLEMFGDFCYLAIVPGLPHPLNVPPQVWDLPPDQAAQQVMQRVQWPTPFWADDSWPFVSIAFHDIPTDPWPMSHLAPGMGELKFLNWAYSFIAGKIRISSRDFIAVLEEASAEITETILRGADYELMKIKGSHGKTIDQVVQFLQHPGFNADIWRVIEAIAEQFDKRVGLNELMYGMSGRQDRSATESQTKREQMNVRPDEMANRVEDAMSLIARQEAIAIRWHLNGQDVAPVVGPVGSAMWDKFITPSNPAELLYQLEYRIEAGSVRKPNRDREAANIRDATQMLMPFYQNLAMQGLVGPFNQLLELWCKSADFKSDGLLIPQPAPPQPPNPAAPPPQQGQNHPQPQPQGAK